MARRRRSKKRSHAKQKLPLFATAGAIGSAAILAGAAPAPGGQVRFFNLTAPGSRTAANAGKNIGLATSNVTAATAVATPLVLGVVASWGASKLGLNRFMRKLPFNF